MREIKFRIWDLNELKMAYQDDGYCINTYIYSLDNACELMQYTGLKDKNGKEIYEGDICKFYNQIEEKEMLLEIEFEDGNFWDYAEHITSNNCEVIGNIYENPELLDDKND